MGQEDGLQRVPGTGQLGDRAGHGDLAAVDDEHLGVEEALVVIGCRSCCEQRRGAGGRRALQHLSRYSHGPGHRGVRPGSIAVLDAVRARDPALLVLDVELPGPDQAAVLAAVQSEAPNVPVIAVTPRERRAGLLAQLRGDRDDYLLRPFAVDELAARIRLRPILMTSLAFILGTLPLVFATGAGQEARHSVGTVVAGGMVASTFLNLAFIPVLYVMVKSVGRGRE